MSASLRDPGRFEILDLPSRVKREAFFVRLVDDHLRSGFPASAVRVLVDSACPQAMLRSLTRLSGKRRTRFLCVTSTFEFLQSLLRPTRRMPPTVRTRLDYECRALLREHAMTCPRIRSLDELVLSDPGHPAAAAYLAGLGKLGYDHPYINLEMLQIPVGLSVLFHADFHMLHPLLRQWFLGSLNQGTSIVALRPYAPLRTLDPSLVEDTPAPDQHSGVLHEFRSASQRYAALLDAARSGRYATIVFQSDSDMRVFELTCLCSGLYVRTSSQPSFVFSPSLRVVHLLLDWLVLDSDGALDSVFAMLDGIRSHWRSFALGAALPVDLDRAVQASISSAAESELRSVRLVAALSELHAEFALAQSETTKFSLVSQFASSYAPPSLTSDLALLCDFINESSVSLRRFHETVTGALTQAHSRGAVELRLFDSHVSLASDWLFVPEAGVDPDSLSRYEGLVCGAPSSVYALQDSSHG